MTIAIGMVTIRFSLFFDPVSLGPGSMLLFSSTIDSILQENGRTLILFAKLKYWFDFDRIFFRPRNSVRIFWSSIFHSVVTFNLFVFTFSTTMCVWARPRSKSDWWRFRESIDKSECLKIKAKNIWTRKLFTFQFVTRTVARISEHIVSQVEWNEYAIVMKTKTSGNYLVDRWIVGCVALVIVRGAVCRPHAHEEQCMPSWKGYCAVTPFTLHTSFPYRPFLRNTWTNERRFSNVLRSILPKPNKPKKINKSKAIWIRWIEIAVCRIRILSQSHKMRLYNDATQRKST